MMGSRKGGAESHDKNVRKVQKGRKGGGRGTMGELEGGKAAETRAAPAALLLLPFSRGDIIVPLPEGQRREGRGQGEGWNEEKKGRRSCRRALTHEA